MKALFIVSCLDYTSKSSSIFSNSRLGMSKVAKNGHNELNHLWCPFFMSFHFSTSRVLLFWQPKIILVVNSKGHITFTAVWKRRCCSGNVGYIFHIWLVTWHLNKRSNEVTKTGNQLNIFQFDTKNKAKIKYKKCKK